MTKITNNLSRAEVTCRCGCGLCNLNHYLAEIFQQCRSFFGEPIIVTSGCRCPKHNQKIGGSPTSSHLKGQALDITCQNPTWKRMLKLAYCTGRSGIMRLGIHSKHKFLHIAFDPDKPQEVFFED